MITPNQPTQEDSGRKLYPVDTKNTDFGISVLGQDCKPLQWVREITENGIQAVQARGIDGRVVWREHSNSTKRWGVPKLCCIDTGTGIAPNDMRELVGRVFSSGRTVGHDKNFGIGAKISLLAEFSEGAEFESWQNSQGCRGRLFVQDDKSYYEDLGPAPVDEMPDEIRKAGGSGTMVTILGNDLATHNTFEAPPGVDIPSSWVIRELNKRYYSFPEGIKVSAPSQGAGTIQAVKGQDLYIEEHNSHRGSFELEGLQCTVHWAVMPHTKERVSHAWQFGGGARIGVLYNGELYGLHNGSGAAAILQSNCGIVLEANKVAMILEPHNALPTTQRSELKIEGRDLPFNEYYAAISDNLPEPILAMIRNKMQETVNTKQRVKHMIDRIYQPGGIFGKRFAVAINPKGSLPAQEDVEGNLFDSAKKRSSGGDNNPGGPGGSGNTPTPDTQTDREAKKGRDGKGSRRSKNPSSMVPETIWVNGSSENMEGQFARLVDAQNTLIFNKDFQPYKRIERDWVKRVTDEARGSACDIVRSEYETLVIEVVVAARMMQGSPGMDSEWLKEQLSDSALTSLGMLCYRQEADISRKLKKFLKKTDVVDNSDLDSKSEEWVPEMDELSDAVDTALASAHKSAVNDILDTSAHKEMLDIARAVRENQE